MSLHVERSTHSDGSTYLVLSGAIDDTAHLEPIFQGVNGKTTFNLQRIERFNSIGIKRWIPLFAGFAKANPTVVEAIAYPVVMQVNCVADLFGVAEVRSCVAPYYCSPCGSSQTVLVTVEEVLSAKDGVPEKNCGQCKAPMSFDELDGYFSFFSRRTGV